MCASAFRHDKPDRGVKEEERIRDALEAVQFMKTSSLFSMLTDYRSPKSVMMRTTAKEILLQIQRN